MCGRFYIDDDWNDIFDSYGIIQDENSNYVNGEIYPSYSVPVIINDNGKKIRPLHWGFPMGKGKKELINARCETIIQRPTFKNSFQYRRCIIPANGFFEWHSLDFGSIKYKINFRDLNIFSMAGIYNLFTDKNGVPFWGFVIITTQANENMMQIHDRMPVIIKKDMENAWLNINTDISILSGIMHPFPSNLTLINPA